VYNIITTDGPSHNPIFTMKMVVDQQEFVATGTSKKAAKCSCAAKAAQELNVDQYLKDRMKVYRYRICTLTTGEQSNHLEDIWNGNAEEVTLVIKRYNEEEYELKTINLRVVK